MKENQCKPLSRGPGRAGERPVLTTPSAPGLPRQAGGRGVRRGRKPAAGLL